MEVLRRVWHVGQSQGERGCGIGSASAPRLAPHEGSPPGLVSVLPFLTPPS